MNHEFFDYNDQAILFDSLLFRKVYDIEGNTISFVGLEQKHRHLKSILVMVYIFIFRSCFREKQSQYQIGLSKEITFPFEIQTRR